jgi:hypothetical protein
LFVLGIQSELRARKQTQLSNAPACVEVTKKQWVKYRTADNADPIAALKAGLRTVRHHKPGWLKEDLIAEGKLEDTKHAIHDKIWADCNAQLIHIRAQQDIMGPDFDPLRVVPTRNEDDQFAFTKVVDVPKNCLSLTYLLHAYDVNASTFKRLRLRGGEALTKQVPHNKGLTVLTDTDFAASVYTARYFYIQAQIKL